MIAAAAILLCAVLAAAADNLAVNPGFEQAAGGEPEGWRLFVLPHEGALGRLDAAARSGKHALLLHTALPYPSEPSNNWSQNLKGGYGGRRLRAAVWVRTETAANAQLWVQCWAARPQRLLHTAAAKAGEAAPAWRELTVEFDVPRGADFLTLRCVLEGTGSAWFDDVYLGEAAAPPPAPALPAAPPPATPAPAPAPAPTAPAPAPASAPAAAPASAPAAALAPVPAAALDAIGRMQQELEAVREANVFLGETLDGMRAENARLLDELSAVRRQVETIERQAATALPPAPSAPPRPRRAPPLVPHGVDWRTWK